MDKFAGSLINAVGSLFLCFFIYMFAEEWMDQLGWSETKAYILSASLFILTQMGNNLDTVDDEIKRTSVSN